MVFVRTERASCSGSRRVFGLEYVLVVTGRKCLLIKTVYHEIYTASNKSIRFCSYYVDCGVYL